MSTAADIGPPFNVGDNTYKDSNILQTRFNLNEVYQAAFGTVRPPYPELVKESKGTGLLPFGSIGALKGSFKLKSIFNTDYTLPTKIDDWQIPQEPVIRIRGGVNIVETSLVRLDPVTNAIQRKNVLEEANLNNYQITIRGVILNEENFNSYPEEAIRRLKEIVEKPGSRSIENGITALWGITKIKIVDWDLDEVEGYLGAQAFELQCKSDEDFELEINENIERVYE
ncbi:DUF6046 domain-containing protein [Ohtaekwangia kribbensis]|uniref:DUF6046 domain-containing protein n=1 Tax=Ohtaekwangia kribbensis TaxID=688913 RepID=A0ABW3JV77_9BACT